MSDLCPGCLRRLTGIVSAIGEPGYFNRPADRADQLADLSFARQVLDAATDRLETRVFANRVLNDIKNLPTAEEPTT